jgi:integrase
VSGLVQRKSDDLAVSIDGYQGRLYRRVGTENFGLRVKLPDGGSFRQTTGQAEQAAARAKAMEIMVELKIKAQHNLSPRTKKFAKVAEAAVEELEREADQPGRMTTAQSYVYVINSYLIPFFGNYYIGNIERPLLARFDEWRRAKLGRNPKKSTIQTHNAALSRVFRTALSKGWIRDWQVPALENSGDEGETGATFTQDEFERLTEFMGRWVHSGRDGLSRQIRFALRELVLTVARTGMRPGTETAGLTWADVEEDYRHGDGETYLRLWVTEGKTDKREIIAPSDVRTSLARLRDYNSNIKPSFPVFATWDGRYPEFCHPFKRLLIAADLLRDRHGDERTLYSLRHFYATRQRERGVSFEVLSTQMGTSIAMLEKHYVHVTATADARLLAGLPDPKIALVHQFIVGETERQARETLTLNQGSGRPLKLEAGGKVRAA